MDNWVILLLLRLFIGGAAISLFLLCLVPILRLADTELRKARLRSLGFNLLRALAAYAVFVAVSSLLNLMFINGGIVLAKEQDILFSLVYIFCSLLLPLSFYSINRAFELYDKSAQEAYPLGAERKYERWEGMRSLFRVPVLREKLLTSLSVYLVLLVILPYQMGYTAVAKIFFPEGSVDGTAAAIISLALVAPALVLFTLLAKSSAHKWWCICRTSELDKIYNPRNHTVRLFFEILKISAIYAVAYPILPASIMMIVSVALIFGILTVWIWVSLFAVIFGLILLRIFLSTGKRRKFIKKLRREAEGCGYEIKFKNHPVLSLIFPNRKSSFTLSRAGKSYECKIIGTANCRRPVYISPNGYYTQKRTVSLMAINLFHILTDTAYEFEGENKLVIYCPPGKRVYFNYGRTDTAPDDGDGGTVPTLTSMRGAAMGNVSRGRSVHGPGYVSDVDRGIIRKFITGTRIGEYKFFADDDFISAIRNDYIDRTEK